MFKIQHKKFAALLLGIFFLCAVSLFAQTDSTGSGAPSESEVNGFIKIVFFALSKAGVHIAPTWSALVFLIVPIIWRWILVKRLKRTIKANQEVAAKNNELPAGHGEAPVEHVGIIRKFINFFKRK